MEDDRDRLTIVILENRQTIATILSDLLTEAGYGTRLASRIDHAEEILPECQPGFLLVDLGMIHPDIEISWQKLQEQADSYHIPVLAFSCSAVPEAGDNILLLRSPGDFAKVVQRIEAEWRKEQPLLGTTLIKLGLIDPEELAAILRVQRELAQIGRSYPLGDLFVRLDIISAEDVERALQEN